MPIILPQCLTASPTLPAAVAAVIHKIPPHPTSPAVWAGSQLPAHDKGVALLFFQGMFLLCGELQRLFSSSMFAMRLTPKHTWPVPRGWHSSSSLARQLCCSTPTASPKTLGSTEGRKLNVRYDWVKARREFPPLSERSLTKGKASWFGWVSPEQRLVSGKDGFCRETPVAQQVHMWLPLCPMAEAGGSAAAVAPVVALTTAPAPGTGTGAAGQQWCVPPPLLSWTVVSPHHSVLSGEPPSWTPFACTIYAYFIQKCLSTPGPLSRTLWTKQASRLAEAKTRGLSFLISSWSYLLLLKIQRNLCLLWGCVWFSAGYLEFFPFLWQQREGREALFFLNQECLPTSSSSLQANIRCLHEGLELPPLQNSWEMCRVEGSIKKDKFSASGFFTYLEWTPGEIAETPSIQAASSTSEQTAQIQLRDICFPCMESQPCPCQSYPLQPYFPTSCLLQPCPF